MIFVFYCVIVCNERMVFLVRRKFLNFVVFFFLIGLDKEFSEYYKGNILWFVFIIEGRD